MLCYGQDDIKPFLIGLALWVIFVLSYSFTADSATELETRKNLYLMPWPKDVIRKEGIRHFEGKIKTYVANAGDNRVEKAIARFATGSSLIFQKIEDRNKISAEFNVRCGTKSPKYPALYDDESYSLRIDKELVAIDAPTSMGCIRALTTLGQLFIDRNDPRSLPIIEINDAPRFPWRGLLIDVVRHWIPKEAILRNIRAMAEVKMNVLHLHLSDDQGFRVESKIFPKLHEVAGEGNYYTQEDISEIVEYAASFGIRVVPEFDVPGHATAWLFAYPELASGSAPISIERDWGIFKPVMDPTKAETYIFLDRLFKEMITLFPDDHFHIGGDEVLADKWLETPHIRQFMAENKLNTAWELQALFNQKIVALLQKYNRRPIGWNEILTPNLSKQVVIQLWENEGAVDKGLKSGHKLIQSYGYYLDHLVSVGAHYSVDPVYGQRAFELKQTLKWRKWKLDIFRDGREINGEMLLYESEALYHGYITVGTKKIRFKNALIKNGILEIKNVTEIPLGLQFSLKINNNSLTGRAIIPGIEATVKGRLIAGSEKDNGISPVRDRLPSESLSNMLGLEAVLWTEWVSAGTLDSRLWPRLAAIAEKAWSEPEATLNTEDMYRRLNFIDRRLEGMGLQHRSYPLELINKLAGSGHALSLEKFISALEPVKYYSSLKKMRTTNMLTPLEMIADAAVPDGRAVRHFNQAVDRYIVNPTKKDFLMIQKQLKEWQLSYSQLEPIFESLMELREVRPLAITLVDLSAMALAALKHMHAGRHYCSSKGESLLERGFAPLAAVQIAIVPAIENLVSAACNVK
ncbi:MAG: family 20 glycosylhydrolase [Emcibacter sp.]|nr:family 20 glycosylhydrolase [Emcibacter sp.]